MSFLGGKGRRHRLLAQCSPTALVTGPYSNSWSNAYTCSLFLKHKEGTRWPRGFFRTWLSRAFVRRWHLDTNILKELRTIFASNPQFLEAFSGNVKPHRPRDEPADLDPSVSTLDPRPTGDAEQWWSAGHPSPVLWYQHTPGSACLCEHRIHVPGAKATLWHLGSSPTPQGCRGSLPLFPGTDSIVEIWLTRSLFKGASSPSLLGSLLTYVLLGHEQKLVLLGHEQKLDGKMTKR